MNKREILPFPRRQGLLEGVFGIVLTAASLAVFFFVYMRHYTYATRFAIRGNYLLLLVYVFLLTLFLHLYGGFHIRNNRTRELGFSYALASFIANAIMYAVLCLVARRMLPVGDILLVMIIQWLAALVLYIAGRILIPLLSPTVSVLYIHPFGEKDRDIASKFEKRRTSYAVRGQVDEELPRRELLRSIDAYQAVILGPVSPETRQVVIGYCYRTGKKVLLIPDMTDIMVGSAAPLVMKDFLLYDLNTQGRDIIYYAAKRTVDILVSGLALLILSPLMLLIALAIKLQDGGPVLYRQTRLTRGGREFRLAKFRSMIVDAEKSTGAVLAGKHDDRITPVGGVLRACRLDELPQLWNILVGDMTLVGPRPERPEFYETICADYPEFNYRLMVKAGLTGYAQLYGRYNTDFADKARLDMYYIQHASFLWDIELMFYTLKILFIRESTEGVEEQEGSEEEKETVSSRGR